MSQGWTPDVARAVSRAVVFAVAGAVVAAWGSQYAAALILSGTAGLGVGALMAGWSPSEPPRGARVASGARAAAWRSRAPDPPRIRARMPDHSWTPPGAARAHAFQPDLVTRAGALRVLGLPLAADASAIRARYRELAHAWHPDKVERLEPTQMEAARARMASINAAYALLVRG